MSQVFPSIKQVFHDGGKERYAWQNWLSGDDKDDGHIPSSVTVQANSGIIGVGVLLTDSAEAYLINLSQNVVAE